MNVEEKRDALLEEDLCKHCLGRQFAQLGHGLENYERGAIAEKIDELEEESFKTENIPEKTGAGGSCWACKGIFEELNRYVEMVEESFERYELNTFLVGIRPPEDVIHAEEQLWEKYGVEWTEPIKTELSRLIGKRIEKEKNLEVNFKRPDINAVVDMREGKERIELQVNSLLIYGQYNKYSREIPQTTWHCRNCRGDGCEKCNWTGKQYQTSVQEIIQEPFIRQTEAIEAKFHGGGREDVDARCLGKREFVLELIEPLKRNIDLEKLQEEVNNSQEKVEIFNLREAEKDEIEEIKQKHADKKYRVQVKLDEEINEEDLKKLEKLVGEIKQETPERVTHRRAEKIRKRQVYSVEYTKKSSQKIEFEIKAEAGTYIKELVRGDNNRTQPNISDLLNTQTEVETLDVIEIEK